MLKNHVTNKKAKESEIEKLMKLVDDLKNKEHWDFSFNAVKLTRFRLNRICF